ncbi:MAG: hypothetical protein PHU21_04975, partial [Elusimicrobia bacterium]|nr:hypothetical protein [Elusimicrobiota bacterium]
GPIDKMAHNLSGSKLSSGVKSQAASSPALAGVGVGGSDLQKSMAESGQLGKFGQNAAKAGSGGTLVAKNIRLGQGMKLRHLASRNSRSLALLRGMASKYNPAIRSGTRVTEANTEAATAQFQANELVGGTPPTSPADTSGGGSPGVGVGGGGASPSNANYSPTIDNERNCDYEAGAYWNGVACVTKSAPGQNATPWQKQVDKAEKMVYAAGSCLAMSAILSMLAEMIPYNYYVYWTLCYIADLLGVAGTIMGLMIIQQGAEINSMGGSPQGSMFMIAGGITVLNGMLATYFAWMGGSPETLVVVLAIVAALGGINAGISAKLGKAAGG